MTPDNLTSVVAALLVVIHRQNAALQALEAFGKSQMNSWECHRTTANIFSDLQDQVDDLTNRLALLEKAS